MNSNSRASEPSARRTAASLRSLCRGELAAVETYQHALGRVKSGDAVLRRIQDEHRQAANLLRVKGEPSGQALGAWGFWRKAMEGAGWALESDGAIQALEEGEKQEAQCYEAALNDANMPAVYKMLIISKLLPACKAHVQALERLSTARTTPQL